MTSDQPKLFLGVESVRRHVTNEADQFQLGLREAGWTLCGRGLDVDCVDVPKLLRDFKPRAAILQDRREWDVRPSAGKTPGNWRNPADYFQGWECLEKRPDILRLSVLKDVQNSEWYRQLGIFAGLDGWVHYYHPDSIAGKAPWVKRDQMVRTWHTVDAEAVPPFADQRAGCILSGYAGRSCESIYPLRCELLRRVKELPETTALEHPGYGEVGCHSTNYLNILNRYKVAICTASIYDFSLRKITEAAACGCLVVTNLVERLPDVLEQNLLRVGCSVRDAADAVRLGLLGWESVKQRVIAKSVKREYDWRVEGRRLSQAIDDFGRRVKGWQ